MMKSSNTFGFILMQLSVAAGIVIFLNVGNTLEVFYAAPTLLMGVYLYEKK